MRAILTGAAVCAILTASFAFAARSREQPPTAAQIEKASELVKYRADATAKAKYKGHEMTFVPCDISDIGDAAREKGMIVGKLVTTWPSPDKLPVGTYLVFVRKHNDQWEAYFCQKHQPIAKSTEVKSGLDDKHHPDFEVDNTTIRYWRLRIAY